MYSFEKMSKFTRTKTFRLFKILFKILHGAKIAIKSRVYTLSGSIRLF